MSFNKSETGEAVYYDNGLSGLTSDNVKDAIDELAGMSGGPPTGTPNTLAWFDSLGDLGSLPGWDITDLGYLHNIVSIPSGDVRADFDQISVQTNLTGTITNMARANYFNLSGGTNPIQNIIGSQGSIIADVDGYLALASYTATGSAGGSADGIYLQLDSDVTADLRLLSVNANGTVTGNFYGLNIYDNTSGTNASVLINAHSNANTANSRIGATISNSGNITGNYDAFSNYNNGTVGGFANGVVTSANGDITKGLIGFNTFLNANMGDGSGVNYVGFNTSTTAGKTIDGQYFGMAMSNQADVLGQIIPVSIVNSGDYEGFTGMLINNTGTVVGNNAFFLANVTQNAPGYAFAGISLFVNEDQSEYIKGLYLNSIGDCRTASGLDVYMSGNATDDMRGLRIDVQNMTSTNSRPISMEIAGGVKTNNGKWVPRNAMTVEVGDYDGHQATVSSPLTGSDVIAQIFQPQLFANDNIVVGPIGLGYVNQGLLPQVQVASGKTIDMMRSLVVGTTVPTGSGGTITEHVSLEVLGLPSSGGSVTNPTRIGIQDSTLLGQNFSDGATDVWFLRVRDTTAENYLGKSLAIGTGTMKVTNSDVAFEIGSTKAMRHGQLTTTQRDALTALSGMMIYNTTTNDVEYYDGSAWQGHVSNIDGGSAGTVYGASLSIDGGSA